MASTDSQPHLTELSRNNDLPSESELQQAFDLRSILQGDLLQVETEIRRLKEKKAGIQKSIDTYNAILSPARRLLPDILREIFYHCLPEDRNPTLSAKEAPMLLTRICSIWRAIALSSPQIWARIHIGLPGNPSLSFGVLPHAAITKRYLDFSKVMELRCQVVKDWLTRSGTCPLSISISHPIHFGEAVEDSVDFDPEAHDVTEPLFRQITSFSSRWKHVELSMPFSVYKKLESLISGDDLPLLNSLRSDIERDPISEDPTPFSPRFLEAPNLQRLSLNFPQLSYNTPRFLSIWSRLTDLRIQTVIIDLEFYDIISLCRNLVTCQVDNLEAPWFDPSREQTRPHMEVIIPNLQMIKIHESNGISHVVQAINAPRLRSLNYRCLPRYRSLTVLHPTSVLGADGLLTIVERGTSTLRKLTLEPRYIRPDDTVMCLRLANKVSHLVLTGTSFPFGIEDDALGNDSFDLHLLTVHNNSGTREILLPKLEVLEVDDIRQFSDEEILDLLTSRLDAARRGDVSPLRRLKLRFTRHRQRDITEEASERAKCAGYELNLELDYPLDGLPYNGRLSPSFAIPIRSSIDEAWPPVIS